MSHASLIVALSAEDIQHHGGVEEAVAWQMEPFDENGEWFADGSRWDWFQIGGRFTGKFDSTYDPEEDERNHEVCQICHGSGRHTDAIGKESRRADPSYTCNGCAGKGTRVKWPTAWDKFAGDVMSKVEVETKVGEKLEAFAFLKDRRWHEVGRLGWFGSKAPTECEIKAKEETGEKYTGRCIHKDRETGAQIVSWGEEDDEEGRWARLFWARFIRPLPPETMLVVVDYHV